MDQSRGHQRLAAALNSSIANAPGRAAAYDAQSRGIAARERYVQEAPKEKGRARRAAETNEYPHGYPHLRPYMPTHPSLSMGAMSERQAYLESHAAAARSYYAGLPRTRPDQRHELEAGSMYGLYSGYAAPPVRQEGAASPKGKEKRAAAAQRRKKSAPAEASTPPAKQQQGDISIFPRRKAGQSGIGSNRPPVVVTREVLEENFNMPLLQVCKKLGLCATVLKKVCRQLGVHKWPYKETKLSARRQGKLLAQTQPANPAPTVAAAGGGEGEGDGGSAPGGAGGAGGAGGRVEVKQEAPSSSPTLSSRLMEVNNKEEEEEEAPGGGSAQGPRARGAVVKKEEDEEDKEEEEEEEEDEEEPLVVEESAFKSSPPIAAVEAAGEMGEEETLAVWSEEAGEMMHEGGDEFLSLGGSSDLQPEEMRWWMCAPDGNLNGMLADTRGPFTTSPPLDGATMRWADNN